MNKLLLGASVALVLCAEARSQTVTIVNGQKVLVPSARAASQKGLPTGYVPPTSTGSGSHTSFLVNGSDNCANAAASDAISGLGTFGVSNVGATTGSPLANCGAIGLDVWFYWTSTVTGTVIINACG